MNSDSFRVLRNDYPTGHPYQLQTAAYNITGTETVFLLQNGTPAVLFMPLQTDILGSSTPMDPSAGAALSADVLGGESDFRGLRGRPYFHSGSFDGRGFRIRVTGNASVVQGGTATNVILTLYMGTSATVGSDTAINATTTSGNVIALSSTITGPFIAEWTLLWDSTQQKITGESWIQYCGGTTGYGGRAGFASVAQAAYSGLNFVVSQKFTTAPTSSAIVVRELSMEAF